MRVFLRLTGRFRMTVSHLMHSIPLGSCIAGVLLLVGCSGPPSERTGRKALEHRIQNQSHGAIRLVDFKKTNGRGTDDFYRVEFEAEIEFAANGVWLRGT